MCVSFYRLTLPVRNGRKWEKKKKKIDEILCVSYKVILKFLSGRQVSTLFVVIIIIIIIYGGNKFHALNHKCNRFKLSHRALCTLIQVSVVANSVIVI